MSTSAIGTTGSRAQATSHAPPADLKPKEHGAYAILAIPVITALIITGPTMIGLCISAASIAGFLCHEPLLITIGHRGKRAQRSTPAAQNRLAILAMVLLSCGLTSLALGDDALRLVLIGCVFLASINFSIALAGKHRTFAGQLIGVLGLSVPCIPILMAGKIDFATATETWITWILGFTGTTVAVRGVIAAQKRHRRLLHWTTLGVLTVLMGAALQNGFRLPLVIAPMLVMSWYLMIAPPPANHLKRVGWTLVLGTILSSAWMIAVMLK